MTVEGVEFSVQGFEPFFLRDLTSFGLRASDLGMPPVVPWLDARKVAHAYHPDFFVPGRKLVIEIKSTWTMNRRRRGRAVRKMRATLEAGYDFMMVVYLDAVGSQKRVFAYKHASFPKLRQMMREVRL